MSRKLDRKLFSDIGQQTAWNYDPWERENKWGPICAPITARKQFPSQSFEEPGHFTELREQRSECEGAMLSRICQQKAEEERAAHKESTQAADDRGVHLTKSLASSWVSVYAHMKPPLRTTSK